RSARSRPEPATRSRTVWETRTSEGAASALTRAPIATARPPIFSSTTRHPRPALTVGASDLLVDDPALAGVEGGAHLEPERAHALDDRLGTADPPRRPVERGEEPVAPSVALPTAGHA